MLLAHPQVGPGDARTSPGQAQEEVVLVSIEQPNGGTAAVPCDLEATDRVSSLARAEHLVEAARELLDEAAAIVPDPEISDELRECLHMALDPILRQVGVATAHARAERS
jgi:hypothetical protein